MRVVLAALGSIAAAAAAQVCSATTDEPRLGTRDWLAAAYFYAPAISGQASLGPVSAPLSLNAEDLLGGAKNGFMGYARKNYARNFVYSETIAVHFKRRTFDAFFGLPVNSSLRFFEAGVGRDLLANSARTRLSAYLGARYLAIDITAGAANASLRGEERGTDLALGSTLEYQLTSRLTLAAKADVAGFGGGRRRYASVSAFAIAQTGEHWQVFGGWRQATFRSEPSPSGLQFDLDGRGPQIGFSYDR